MGEKGVHVTPLRPKTSAEIERERERERKVGASWYGFEPGIGPGYSCIYIIIYMIPTARWYGTLVIPLLVQELHVGHYHTEIAVTENLCNTTLEESLLLASNT